MRPRGWRWGVDFAAGSGAVRVLAVYVPYEYHSGADLEWVGPVALDGATAAALDRWAWMVTEKARWPREPQQGHVHLFPADSDAGTEWLLQWDAAEDDEAEETSGW